MSTWKNCHATRSYDDNGQEWCIWIEKGARSGHVFIDRKDVCCEIRGDKSIKRINDASTGHWYYLADGRIQS